MIFNKQGCNKSGSVSFLSGSRIENVKKYKYLGCALNKKMNKTSEIYRLTNTFNKSVGMFLGKLPTVQINVKMKMLNSLCMSLYGIVLFYETSGCAAALRRPAVSYHYGLKRGVGVAKHFSNHYTCKVLNVFTFDQLLD